MRFCPHCGNRVDDGAFCPNCGKSLSGPVPAQQPQPGGADPTVKGGAFPPAPPIQPPQGSAGGTNGGRKKSKKGLIIALVAALLAVLLIIGALIAAVALIIYKRRQAIENGDPTGAVSETVVPSNNAGRGSETAESRAGDENTPDTGTCKEPTVLRETPVHVHAFGEWIVVKEPTCTTEGTEERTCSDCGDKETKTVAATGHDYGNWRVMTEATCTQNGRRERTCNNCGEKETETLPATGHDYGYWRVMTAATCTGTGLEERSCNNCNGKETRTVLALGHNYVNGVCTRCGLKVNEPTFIVGSASGKKGDTVRITVSVQNNPGIWGMDLLVEYDRSALTLVEVENGNFFADSEWTQGDLSLDAYILCYESDSLYTNNTTSGALVATLVFRIRDNAASGSHFVTVSYDQKNRCIIDVDFNEIDFAIVSGSVEVK